jgi:hypothetical protein
MFECILFQSFESITIFLHIMLEYNLGERLKENYLSSFYKVGDWSIFVGTNVMYFCIQKHNYIS